MKKKLLITEEEKNIILNSHIRAGYKTNIFEINLNNLLNENETFTGKDLTPEGCFKAYQYLLNLQNTNKELLDEIYNKSRGLLMNWRSKLKTLGETDYTLEGFKKAAPITYQVWSYLASVAESYEKQPDREKIDRIFVKQGQDVLTQKELPSIPKEPQYFEGESFPLMLDGTKGQVFIDNQSVTSPLVIQSFTNLIQTQMPAILQKSLADNPDLKAQYDRDPSQFKWECNDVMVYAAASRFSNTGRASGMNFITLSKERATNAYNSVMKILQDSGVVFGEKFKQNSADGNINYFGKNKDGTNGPPPPYGNRMANLKNESQVGGSPNYLSKGSPNYDNVYNESVAKYGQPLATKEEYEKFKILKIEVNLSIVFTENSSEEGEKPQVEYERFPNFTITYIMGDESTGGGGGGGKRRRPPRYKKRRRNNKPRSTIVDACFKNPGWWDKLNF